jgi:GT2 family glycosyltransferase
MTNGGPTSEALPGHSPPVVCVIVNWNGWRDTLPCLQSLAGQDYPALHTLVVDNASTDDSVDRIRAAFPEIELIQSPANRGFASGCNLGARLALERGANFVWLLNNDTVAPPDTLIKLVAAASNPQTGMVGTVLRYAHNPDQVQAWGGGTIVRSLGYGTHFLAPAALGPDSFLTFASVLIRRELFESVGFLDEGFFMYFEDSDLCFRARAAGWQFAVASDTAVLHKEGGSNTSRSNPRTDRIVTASGLRFLRRHGRPCVLAPMLFLLSRLGKRLVRGDFAGMRAVLRGALDWWLDTPMAFQAEP